MPERFGAAFGEVGAALEQLELGEGVGGAAAVHDLARPGPGDRALEPRRDRILAGAGFAQLALKLGDVGLVAAQHLLDLVHLGAQAVGHLGRLLAFDQRGLGEVVAILGSASSALAVQSVWISSSRLSARRISLMSAIERAAVARTSTNVSSISRMTIRIIRAGSSDRSRSSVMFAAKMSRARLNTGPLSQPATGASRVAVGSGSRLDQLRRADRNLGFEDFEFRH